MVQRELSDEPVRVPVPVRVRMGLNDREQAEAAAAAELDDVLAAELIRKLAQRRLAELGYAEPS